jgi:hypothetical protein
MFLEITRDVWNDIQVRCKYILEAEYLSHSIGETAMDLQEALLRLGIISSATTYQEINQNHVLKSGLFESLILSLPNEVNSSKYGCDVLSDYEIGYTLKSNVAFTHRMNQLQISNKTHLYRRLSLNRGNIRKYIHRLLDKVIDWFDVVDAPTKKGKYLKYFRTKPSVITEMVEQRINH